MFLNIQIYLLILKTYYGQFTLTTKNHCISSLRLIENIFMQKTPEQMQPKGRWQF